MNQRKTRFELATLALARRCSTTELLPRDPPYSEDPNLRPLVLSPARVSRMPAERLTGPKASAGIRKAERLGKQRLEL